MHGNFVTSESGSGSRPPPGRAGLSRPAPQCSVSANSSSYANGVGAIMPLQVEEGEPREL